MSKLDFPQTIFSKQGKELITKIVSPLMLIDNTLANKAVDYIFNCASDVELTEFHAIPVEKALYLFHYPACIIQNGFEHLEANTLIDNAFKARTILYSLVGKEIGINQLQRLFIFFAEICQGINTVGNLFPEKYLLWVTYLLGDVFYTTRHESFLLSENDQLDYYDRDNWSCDLIAALLHEDHLSSPEDILTIILNYCASIQNTTFSFHDEQILTPLRIDEYCKQKNKKFSVEFIQKLNHDALSFLTIVLYDKKELRNYFKECVFLIYSNNDFKDRSTITHLLSSMSFDELNPILLKYIEHGDLIQQKCVIKTLLRRQENKIIVSNLLTTPQYSHLYNYISTKLSECPKASKTTSAIIKKLPQYAAIADTPLPTVTKKLLKGGLQLVIDEYQHQAEYWRDYDKLYSDYESAYNLVSKYNDSDLDNIIEKLNSGKSALSDHEKNIILKSKITQLSQFTPFHEFRFNTGNAYYFSGHYYSGRYSREPRYNEYNFPFDFEKFTSKFELRQLNEILSFYQINCVEKIINDHIMLQNGFFDDVKINNSSIWPFYACYPELLVDVFNECINETYSEYHPENALSVLAMFPSIPDVFIQPLIHYALHKSIKTRLIAQNILSKIDNIHEIMMPYLSAKKQDHRLYSTEFMEKIDFPEVTPLLHEQLKIEKNEIIRTALLSALIHYQSDVSQYYSIDNLFNDAKKGLSEKLPDNFDWLDTDILPSLYLQNNLIINPIIIRWWIILAIKLKNPLAGTTIRNYINLLTYESQKDLAIFVLQTFINKDIQGSAITFKGMLALITNIDGRPAAQELQKFIKKHPEKRAQIEAMMIALSNSDDSFVIQLLVSIKDRYKHKSIQNKANEILTLIAERHHWNIEELSDRTIPTLELDENGTKKLDFGQRKLIIQLDDTLKFAIFNDKNKEIKSLPTPLKEDDIEEISVIKKQFSEEKKELKILIAAQKSRLFEAMCCQRYWKVADWQTCFVTHPIMNKLTQQLIWLEVKNDRYINQFYLSDKGNLLDYTNNEIILNDDSMICLAHASLLYIKDKNAWIDCFKQQNKTFFISQMDNSLPKIDLNKTEINNYNYIETDSETLHKILIKLGYQHNTDSSYFEDYYKYYSSLNYYVNISFSGCSIFEEKIPVKLHSLSFEKDRRDCWHESNIPMSEVPTVLLAESYAEYERIAKICLGYETI